MCELLEVDAGDICPDIESGVEVSYGVAAAEVEDITMTGTSITAFTMANAGAWVKLKPTQDDTAYFNSVGDRQQDQHMFNQEYFGKFSGLDAAKITAGNALANCCNMIVVHFLNNGQKIVQGIDLRKNAPPGDKQWRWSKQTAKPTVSMYSGQGTEPDRLEIRNISVCKNVMTTPLSIDDIEAL